MTRCARFGRPWELHRSVHELGLEARIGVNTGEVVAGGGDTLVTGDAVNVAARLEQQAGAGDVLLGEETVRLVRDAVVTERVELVMKGKPEPVAAHRLVSLDPAAAGFARRLDRAMVGRERERARLSADFTDAAASRTCRLFTLIGPAGVGKSRLVGDFLGHIGAGATVARGRALSYGGGDHLLAAGRAPRTARPRPGRGDPLLARRHAAGHPRVAGGGRRGAAARPRPRRPPVGGGAAPRSRRASGRLGSRGKEMAILAREAGGAVEVPPTIQAVLQRVWTRSTTMSEP